MRTLSILTFASAGFLVCFAEEKPQSVAAALTSTTISGYMDSTARGGAANRRERAGNERWDRRFAIPGVQGSVAAMAFDGRRIFLGGQLQSVGRVSAESVTRFDGKDWEALEEGPQQHPSLPNVIAMDVYRNRLYVGGFFTNVGGAPAGGFASWRGNEWSVHAITNGEVYALDSDRHGLLVAGRFYLPGFTNPIALARYDGRGRWEVLNSEIPPCGDEEVVCLNSVDQVQLLPNGDAICSLAVSIREWWGGWSFPTTHLLARCDADGNWSNFPGPDDPNGIGEYRLTRFDGSLVVAGDFTNPVVVGLRNIAQWNGEEWQAIGGGLEGPVYGVKGNTRVLYALHVPPSTNVLARAVISQWDGIEWTRIGTIQGTDRFGYLFVNPDDELYVSGLFSGIDGTVAPGIAHWNGRKWKPMFEGSYEGVAGSINSVVSFTEHRGSVYMGGIFLSAGNEFSGGVARWDSEGWHDIGGEVGTSPPLRIRAFASSDDRLFAAGTFTRIGGVPATNIASWNGSKWEALAGAIGSNVVVGLAWWQSNLYAGGRFEEAGGTRAHNIVKWDGSVWHPLAEGCNSNVNVLAVWREGLYVGGRFTFAGSVSVSKFARWNGSQWQDVGGGVSGVGGSAGPTVTALAGDQNNLYVGGQFTIAGSIEATNIARWSGAGWHALGSGWRGIVTSIAVRDGHVFVGGELTDVDGNTLDGIQRWDGTNWHRLGDGLYDRRGFTRVFTLLAREHDLFVGGRFTHAGGRPSANVARWVQRPRVRVIPDSAKSQRGAVRVFGEPGLRLRFETSEDFETWSPVNGGDAEEPHLEFQSFQPGARFFRGVLER